MLTTSPRPLSSGLALFLPMVFAGALHAQREFAGRLDGRLHVDPHDLSIARFEPLTPAAASLLGASATTDDKVFSGMFPLSKEESLRFKAVIVRSADGRDVLYVDVNRNGHFEAGERFAFRTLDPPVDRLKSSATFEVPLPDGPFRICPMEVRLIGDGIPTPAGPGQLAVLYSAAASVEGYAQLPKRKLLMRFAYTFTTHDVDLEHGLEWVDVDGDGKFDRSPASAEFLRSWGSAPVFRAGGLALQAKAVRVDAQSFTIREVAATADQRIALAVGARMPDFKYTGFDGRERRLSEIKGRYRLLDFWATWCVPCVKDLPLQKKAYEELHAQGLEILGMNGDESPERAEKLLDKLGIGWPQARREEHLFGERFQITEWPTVILLDDRGAILSTGRPGELPLDGQHLADTVKLLLARKH